MDGGDTEAAHPSEGKNRSKLRKNPRSVGGCHVRIPCGWRPRFARSCRHARDMSARLASLAHSVEHMPCKHAAPGSTPGVGSERLRALDTATSLHPVIARCSGPGWAAMRRSAVSGTLRCCSSFGRLRKAPPSLGTQQRRGCPCGAIQTEQRGLAAHYGARRALAGFNSRKLHHKPRLAASARGWRAVRGLANAQLASEMQSASWPGSIPGDSTEARGACTLCPTFPSG